ncbi:hypothetical protein ACOSP7_032653 [Xanthoceras sorbifolium]
MSYVPPSPANFPVAVEGGFLKGLATYIVMDNLEFMPMSTTMFVSLLKKSGVKDLDALDEIEVDLGVEEGLKLSLESKTILTSFYFGDRSGHGFLDVKSMDSYLGPGITD